jgi:hypothetical protein
MTLMVIKTPTARAQSAETGAVNRDKPNLGDQPRAGSAATPEKKTLDDI